MNIEQEIIHLSKITEFSIRDLTASFNAIKADQGKTDEITYSWLLEAVYLAASKIVPLLTVTCIMNTTLFKAEIEHKKIPIYGWN